MSQVNTCYPFGLVHPENCGPDGVVGNENRYRYNGKELLEDVGLYDYGARYYDAAVGRWNAVDPLAEMYRPYSTYAYVLNQPTIATDPNGMSCSNCGPNGEAITPVEIDGRASVFGSNGGGDPTYDGGNLPTVTVTATRSSSGLRFNGSVFDEVMSSNGSFLDWQTSYGHLGWSWDQERDYWGAVYENEFRAWFLADAEDARQFYTSL